MLARCRTSTASASSANADEWKSIDWNSVLASVRQLQMRIAKAYREGKRGKVKALQRLLTTSYHAKLLAVRRVVQNKGAKTAGIDGIVWSTHQQARRDGTCILGQVVFLPSHTGNLVIAFS